MRVGIVGASGYAGGELLRLLAAHPKFDPSYIAAGSNAGEEISSIHSHLTSYFGRKFETTSAKELNRCDLIFMALPHGESASLVGELRSDLKIVDLGADFRLSDPAKWEKYYGGAHAGTWVYGLPELPGQREKISGATRVANPGCYATAITLGIAPAITANTKGTIDSSDIVVVAASGTTGAGRTNKVNLSASEIMNSLSSYKFGGVHQHTPEIEEALGKASGTEVRISFTPILAPMPRGILATVTAKTALDESSIREIYQKVYGAENFVTLLPKGQLPETSSLIGSNGIQLQLAVDSHTSRLVVSAALDNLGKGAAGQALQNANLLAGFDETLGLTPMGVGQ
ncbi:MAG: N-acetyl-gamma-glutamyl-phosphate reductase [Candidatus Nanopelagicaceae bacterium]|nr:N-acetyl-gamma-glutamyl-phosphate reductase [Candidatus Nanopelagicaceae bacterium]